MEGLGLHAILGWRQQNANLPEGLLWKATVRQRMKTAVGNAYCGVCYGELLSDQDYWKIWLTTAMSETGMQQRHCGLWHADSSTGICWALKTTGESGWHG